MSTAPGADHVAWERALEEMESFLLAAPGAAAAAGADEAAESWAAPDLGPIPSDLVHRARELLGRQQHVLEELRLAKDAVRHQQAVTERFAAAAPRGDGPVYVDHSA